MDLAQEMRKLWGPGNLRKASPAVLNSLRIPEGSRRFLAETGMPGDEILVVRFDLEDLATGPGPGLRRIAKGMQAPDLLLDENSGGAIVEDGTPPRFVNSSVEQLARFLVEYVRSANRNSLSDEDNAEAVRTLRMALTPLDPAAFATGETWWALVFEQMEQGLI